MATRLTENGEHQYGKERVGKRPIPIGYLPSQLAHFTRPFAVGEELGRQGIPVEMCGAAKDWHQFDASSRTSLPASVTFDDSNAYYYNPREILESDEIDDALVENVVTLAGKLAKDQPPCVISDHDVPLNMAARLAQVPLVTITNTSNVASNLDNYMQGASELAVKRVQRYLRRLEPKQQKWYAKAYERFHGKPYTDEPLSIFDLMEAGDVTILADNPAFVFDNVPIWYDVRDNLPASARFVGSIQPVSFMQRHVDPRETAAAQEAMAQAHQRGQTVVLGSFGTYWRPGLFESLIRTAKERRDMYVAVTMRDLESGEDIPENYLRLGYGDLPALAPHADVLACQGGSGTVYPFLRHGRGGILAVTQNYDQVYNAGLLQAHGLGDSMHLDEVTDKALQQRIDGLSSGKADYSVRVREMAPHISLNGAQETAKIVYNTFLA